LDTLSKIISIGTKVPPYAHQQEEVLEFMNRIYACTPEQSRKVQYLYRHSGIQTRYSCIPDYSLPISAWEFYSPTENLEPFPLIEQRMEWYGRLAPALALESIQECIKGIVAPREITHLITVSCTGMSAPGLDLQIMEALSLPASLYRSSVNFMGCYAAIHGLKWADAICKTAPEAKVLVVCVELCTLHFQRELTQDNLASGMLFSDGAAAVLVTGDNDPRPGFRLDQFYAEVSLGGKQDMAWNITSTGFQMTLSGYIPDLLEANFSSLVGRALASAGLEKQDVTHWCIHPGGKRILEAITHGLDMDASELQHSYNVMRSYGNMSSPTLLFVLKAISDNLKDRTPNQKVFSAAFGPGLTMETFISTIV
jgi:predicted naringenin-chalcone synthase